MQGGGSVKVARIFEFVTAVLNVYSKCYESSFSSCLICILEFIQNMFISIPPIELSQNTQSYDNWRSKDKY
jgi:hypothetical protein